VKNPYPSSSESALKILKTKFKLIFFNRNSVSFNQFHANENKIHPKLGYYRTETDYTLANNVIYFVKSSIIITPRY